MTTQFRLPALIALMLLAAPAARADSETDRRLAALEATILALQEEVRSLRSDAAQREQAVEVLTDELERDRLAGATTESEVGEGHVPGGVAPAAGKVYAVLGGEGKLQAWFEPGGGHRPYFIYKPALEWFHKRLGTPGWTLQRIRALPTLNAGQWCDRHSIRLERLYGTQLHSRGATLPDLGLRPIPREELAVLRPDEIGQPQYTLEGWLEQIE